MHLDEIKAMSGADACKLVKTFLEENDLTIQNGIRELGITRAAYYRWMNGRKPSCRTILSVLEHAKNFKNPSAV